MRRDCQGVRNGPAQIDGCGVCGGDYSCFGCDGEANSGAVYDACGVCSGNNSTCLGCDGVINSGKAWDMCQVCDRSIERASVCARVRACVRACVRVGVRVGDRPHCESEGCKGEGPGACAAGVRRQQHQNIRRSQLRRNSSDHRRRHVLHSVLLLHTHTGAHRILLSPMRLKRKSPRCS